MTPQRIQLRRVAGWRKPEGVVVVSRPSRWGNPYTIDRSHQGVLIIRDFGKRISSTPADYPDAATRSQKLIVAHYRNWLPETVKAEARELLAGKDLACWCPLTDAAGNRVPCHADILLELANPGWTP